MAVKVPPLLHKRPEKSQIAWYKANKMPLPPHLTGEKKGKDDGYSAAQAKRDVGEINKEKAKKKAREAAIAAAAKASKKNKELVSSSERVREMGRRRRESGEGLGGGLETNRDILSYVRAGGTIKAGRLGEAVKSVEEGVATAQKVMDRANIVAKTNPDPKKRFAASGLAQKAMLRTINPTGVNTGIVRGGGNKTYRMITGKAPPYQLKPKTGVSEEIEMNEGKMKDILTGREETARLAAQEKEPPFTPDKKKVRRGPGGPMSNARWLAKKAMMDAIERERAKMKKEEVEQIDELTQGLIGRAADKAAQKSKEAGDYANRQQKWGNRTQNLYRDADYGIARDTERKKGKQADRLKNALGLSPKSRKALKDTEKAISAANEEVEQIDELKKSTLASYVNKAVIDRVSRQERDALNFARDTVDARDKKQLGKTRQFQGLSVKMSPAKREKNLHKAYNRDIGIKRAVRRLASEEVDLVFEQDDTMEKKEMAQTQLHFMKYAAEEILEFIEMGGEIEEWYQNKLSKVHSDMEGLNSYIEGEKRRTGIVEEVEQVDEKAPAGAKFERMVKHIKKGYAKDGLTKQEKSIAYATAWKAYNKKNEEVEQTDEAVRVVDRSYPGVPHDAQKRKDIAATVKKIRKDPDARGGMTGFNRYQDFFGGRKARLGAERTPVGEALDPVGKEDKDIDNDGDSDKTDVYLSKRRKAIGSAIRKKVADKMGK